MIFPRLHILEQDFKRRAAAGCSKLRPGELQRTGLINAVKPGQTGAGHGRKPRGGLPWSKCWLRVSAAVKQKGGVP